MLGTQHPFFMFLYHPYRIRTLSGAQGTKKVMNSPNADNQKLMEPSSEDRPNVIVMIFQSNTLLLKFQNQGLLQKFSPTPSSYGGRQKVSSSEAGFLSFVLFSCALAPFLVVAMRQYLETLLVVVIKEATLHLVGGGQRCCSTSCSAQDGPPPPPRGWSSPEVTTSEVDKPYYLMDMGFKPKASLVHSVSLQKG